MNNLCNCGRETRYSHIVNGKNVESCNKHFVCPTYDELIEHNRELNMQIAIQQKENKLLMDVIKIM